MGEPVFTRKEAGKYADLENIRVVLADLVRPHSRALARKLLQAASHNLMEEYEALALLNSLTAPGLEWTVHTGELILSAHGKTRANHERCCQ